MNRTGIWSMFFLFGLLLSVQSIAYTGEESFDDSVAAAIEYPGWFKRSFLDLPEDLREAGEAGKRGVMIVFGTQGCAYCRALVDRVLSDAEVQGAIRQHFDAIALEMFSDIEMVDPKGVAMTVKQFARLEKAEFSPTVIFYDLDGNPVFRAVGYYPRDRFRTVLDYVIDKAYRIISFGAYLNNREANTERAENDEDPGQQWILKSASPHDQPSGESSKPTLVIFEAGDCDRCRRFQRQVLSDQEIAAALEGFNIQRVDRDAVLPVKSGDNMPIPASSWISALGFTRLPALAFYSSAGQLVLQTDAEVGRQRMRNALGYVLSRSYEQGMSYQHYAYLQAAENSIR